MRKKRPEAPGQLLETNGTLRRKCAALAKQLEAHVAQSAVRERELAEARGKLDDNARMRALGELASGMAHDLNNTLGALSLRIELLANDPNSPAAQGDNIEAIRRICTDAAERVRRLQDFARRRDRPLVPIDPAEVVRDAVDLARSELDRAAQLQGRLFDITARLPALPAVRGDVNDLVHVFINLFLNARDAMPDGGKIEVSALVDANRVRFYVSDQGTGIPEEDLRRIFDPFFTTKGDRGTGLGLSIAAAVMARHGGSISAHNRPRGGATFELDLPIAKTRRVTSSRTLAKPPTPSARRVLVVDDDVEHLEATRRVLQAAGQVVVVESSGRGAIQRFESGERFDVVLCDIGMPDPNGWDVVSAISALAPGTIVYMISGWASEIAFDDPRRGLVADILAKPVALERLYRALAEPPRNARNC
jgi:signal transduction histidine kinase/CheY-like chemotaxis protein